MSAFLFVDEWWLSFHHQLNEKLLENERNFNSTIDGIQTEGIEFVFHSWMTLLLP